ELTELSIRNGSMYAGLTRDIRVTDPLDNYDKVWRGNLACNIIEKEIFYLDQLLNNNNSELITWQQLKKAWSESAKGKKARWFVEIKRQTLYKKDKRNKDWIIFEDPKSKSWMLKKIEKKKERKLSVEHWVERKVNNGEYFAVRCKHCALNQRGKENNCITEIKVDSLKRCIRNMTKNKENWTLPCALDLLLRRKCIESPSEHKLIDSIEIAEMEIELIN
ncbi:3258_t:CDS:2, partial [Gigaspora margarita]